MKILSDAILEAFRAAGVPDNLAVVTRSDRPDLADFQCNGALAAAKQMGFTPRQVAEQIIAEFQDSRFTLSIAGPGFINIRVEDATLARAVTPPRRPSPRPHGLKILDYGGPNIAKQMHVGHLRSLVIGDSLKQVLQWLGYDVISDIHWGDWGFQMGLMVWATQVPELVDQLDGSYRYSIEGLQKLYPLAAQKAKDDPEFKRMAQMTTALLQSGNADALNRWEKLVEATTASVMADLKTLNVGFDLFKGESDTAEDLPSLEHQLTQKGLLEDSDGAKVVRVKDDMPPFMFKTGEGSYLYGATDLATIMQRLAMLPQEIIYIVDQRQELHFRQVFDVADQMGYGLKLTHAGFGTIQGPDGKPLKTRAGGVPKLRDMLDEAIEKAQEKTSDPENARKIALAAIKFNDLQNKRTTNYAYDIDKALAHEGKTGPYLLYQLVRMRSILDKQTIGVGEVKITNDEERQIVLDLLSFTDVVRKVEEQLAPHLLADYLYGLAQKFSGYYARYKILEDSDRLCLIYFLEEYLSLGLDLLGIEPVEEM